MYVLHKKCMCCIYNVCYTMYSYIQKKTSYQFQLGSQSYDKKTKKTKHK